MAYHDLTHPAIHGRLRRSVGKMIGEFFAWRDDVACRKVLGKMTDRELNDIGLSRGGLELSRQDDFRGA